MAEPATDGHDITRFEVRQFMRALGLDPAAVDTLHIHKARAVATLITGTVIHVRITETRTP
jgi:hypothetical protein